MRGAPTQDGLPAMHERDWGPIAFHGIDHAVRNSTMACTFDEWTESMGNLDGSEPQEPQPLKITYELNEGELVDEIVFEDPEDKAGIRESGERLLVSKDAVLDLKKLCEREFERVETLSRMLNTCRCAYFKELLYLREQLILATQPERAPQWDWVRNYEVYWFNPPNYCDGELGEFLKDACRRTNQKLIEENFDLQLKLQGKDLFDLGGDPEMQVRRLMKTIGAARLVKKLHGILCHKETGDQGQLSDFLRAIVDLVPPEEGSGPSTHANADELKRQLHELRSKVRELDGLKKQFKEASDELDQSRALAQQNAQRAAAEAQRAEAERNRAEALEQELVEMRIASSGSDSGLQAAQQRILVLITLLDKQVGTWTNSRVASAPDGAGTNIDNTVAYLEKSVKHLLSSVPKPRVTPAAGEPVVHTKEIVIEKSDPNDQQRISSLESQLMKANQGMDAAHAELHDTRRELELALTQLQSQRIPPTPDRPKTPPPAPVVRGPDPERSIQKGTDPELARELEELLRAKQEWAEMRGTLESQVQKAEDKLRASTEKFEADMEAERRRASERDARAKEKIRKLEEELEVIATRFTRLQEKVTLMKEELKRYKKQAGETIEDSEEEEESDDDDDIPRFLIRYFRRVKNNPKPRWMHLNEDAGLAMKKRQWLMAKKFVSVSGGEVTTAFQFLRRHTGHNQPAQAVGGKKRRRPHSALGGSLGMEREGFAPAEGPPASPGGQDGMWVWVPAASSGPGLGSHRSSRSPSPGALACPAGNATRPFRAAAGEPRSRAHDAAMPEGVVPGMRSAGTHAGMVAPQAKFDSRATQRRSPSPTELRRGPPPPTVEAALEGEDVRLSGMSIISAAASAASAAAIVAAKRMPPVAVSQGPTDALMAHVEALRCTSMLPTSWPPRPRSPDAKYGFEAPVKMRGGGGGPSTPTSRHSHHVQFTDPGDGAAAAPRARSPTGSLAKGFAGLGHRQHVQLADPDDGDAGVPRAPSPAGSLARGFAGLQALAQHGGQVLLGSTSCSADLDDARSSPPGMAATRASPSRPRSYSPGSPQRSASPATRRDSHSRGMEPAPRGTITEMVFPHGGAGAGKSHGGSGLPGGGGMSPEAVALAQTLRGPAAASSPAGEGARISRLQLTAEFAKSLDTPLNHGISKAPSRPVASAAIAGGSPSTAVLATQGASAAGAASTPGKPRRLKDEIADTVKMPMLGERRTQQPVDEASPSPAIVTLRAPPASQPSAPAGRDAAVMAARSMVIRSRSVGVLPLTNASMCKLGGATAPASSLKARRPSGGASISFGRASDTSVSFNTMSSTIPGGEGFRPEVLPPLPPQKVRKGPGPPASWLTAT